jgi:rSAM/selenodomain-associated transferase 2
MTAPLGPVADVRGALERYVSKYVYAHNGSGLLACLWFFRAYARAAPGAIYTSRITGYTEDMHKRKPRTSVIVPVLNERERIRSVIENVESLPSPVPVEVVVVDGDPSGSTLSVLEQGRAVGLIASGGRAGQMNAGARAARGDALVFLHADTRLPEAALCRVRDALDSGCVGGAFDLAFDSGRPGVRLVGAVGRLRSRLTRMPFGDQAQFFARDYFMDMGGYPLIPLMEDVEFMRRIKKRGGRIRIFPDRAVTSARRYQRDGVCRRTLGNWSLQIRYALGADPEELAKRYRVDAKGDP